MKTINNYKQHYKDKDSKYYIANPKQALENEMILRLVSRRITIATGLNTKDNLKKGNDFKFNIKLEDLAVNPILLNALNLISMYAESYVNQSRVGNPMIALSFGKSDSPSTKEKAIEFFKYYLGEFTQKKPELKEDDLLTIMVSDSEIQDDIIECFSK